MAEPFNINDWIDALIHGVGGLDDYERYELVAWADRDKGIADFTLRALANPDCEGSAEVLAAIMERRGGR